LENLEEKQRRSVMATQGCPCPKCQRNAAQVEAAEQLAAAAKEAVLHIDELGIAWRRGVLSEHDGQGGIRSNRNWDVEKSLHNALAAWEKARET
jgi:hypothetical protein